MGHWGGGWAHGFFPFFLLGAGFRLVVVAVVVIGVVYFVRGVGRGGWTRHGESALDILQKRYARGEISKEEFEEMKRNLG